ncbi:hypothetical protein V8B97DRAFT_325038 [Scleroderma yunnanense]
MACIYPVKQQTFYATSNSFLQLIFLHRDPASFVAFVSVCLRTCISLTFMTLDPIYYIARCLPSHTLTSLVHLLIFPDPIYTYMTVSHSFLRFVFITLVIPCNAMQCCATACAANSP